MHPPDRDDAPLRFPDPGLERAYWHERVLANRPYFRKLAAVAIAIYVMALLGNEAGRSWPVLPHEQLIVVRLWAAIGISISILLASSASLLDSPRALSWVNVVAFTALIANHLGAFLAVRRPYELGFFMGLVVQITAVVGLTRLRVVSASVLTAGTFIAFVAGSIAVGDFTNGGRGGLVIYVVSALAIGLFVAVQYEKVTRLAFVRRGVLETQQKQLTELANELRDAHAQSERLLQNVLPAQIATRLKADSRAIADAFDDATILFADISGFTVMSSKISATDLVAFLNQVFSAFDAISHRHGLEKIKTIGDAYMAAAGVPEPRRDHADAVARAAIEMRDFVAQMSAPGGTPLSMRIGIHSGPIVAGVIGTKKLAYDLWGDTVNTASRMESHGLPGAIQISEHTRELLVGKYTLVERGAVEIKGKGVMRTWLLAAESPSADDPHAEPVTSV